jgi:hypothetical protein
MSNKGVLASVVLLGAAAIGGLFYWNALSLSHEQEEKDYHQALELLSEAKPLEAEAIVKQYGAEISKNTEWGHKWYSLLIEVSEEIPDLAQIMVIYNADPKSLKDHEKASTLVGEILLAQKKEDQFKALRDEWKGKETLKSRWFALDADDIIVNGKTDEAIEFLKSQSFRGAEDTGRLLRLALLNINEHPKVTWDYLTEALQKDPKNSDLHIYRARILEASNKPNLAYAEYLAAIDTAPEKPFLKDQLLDFLVRKRDFNDALNLLKESLKSPASIDYFWVKALFWNKAIFPISIPTIDVKHPKATIKPLIDYLSDLKPDQFWDPQGFDADLSLQTYLKTEQATYWLRLLEDLKEDNLSEVGNLLQYNPFVTASWNPDLETALKRVLNYRQTGLLSLSTDLPPDDATKGKQNEKSDDSKLSFFDQLTRLGREQKANPGLKNVPEDIHTLLMSKEVFTAVLLQAGWKEAGLILHRLSVIPSNFPKWVAFDVAEAIKSIQGAERALAFATLQPSEPGLNLLIAELQMESGNPETGLKDLKALSQLDSDVGYRASWLLSLFYIDKKQYDLAIKAIDDQPRLLNDTVGQETLGRIAVLQNNNELADRIYSSIEDKSAEAKSYLARKAFLDKNWNRARKLTELLLKEFPNNTTLQENLKKIIQEQEKIKK